MKASLRTSLATLVGSVALLVAPAAFAVGEPCYNDTDCPGAECGGDVCEWGMAHPMPVGEKEFTCVAAGTKGKGQDGWCTYDSAAPDPHQHCKCKGVGAKCMGVHCTFTKPDQAPPGGGGGTGGSGTAGAPSTAGTGTAGSGTAGTAAKPAPADEGGCSVSVPGGTNTGIALGVGLLGLGLAFARRRR